MSAPEFEREAAGLPWAVLRRSTCCWRPLAVVLVEPDGGGRPRRDPRRCVAACLACGKRYVALYD